MSSALREDTRGEFSEGEFSDAISQGLRRFGANLASEKSAHQSDFSLFSFDTASIKINCVQNVIKETKFLFN